MFDDLTDL